MFACLLSVEMLLGSEKRDGWMTPFTPILNLMKKSLLGIVTWN